MNIGEHITAGVLAGLIIRATLATGSFVGLFINKERHVLIHHHVRKGHISHFSACKEDEHCATLQGLMAAQ